jgi:hypothetical protein
MPMVLAPNHLWLYLERNRRFVGMKGIAHDALIVNIDDLLCVGAPITS